jgi:DNA-binding NarL/FixJ family response regulator
MTRPVRVVVADDQAPFRRAAKAVLQASPGFELVGEAESGGEAVALVAALEPDLVLMDVQMPGVNGIDAARRIARIRPATTVLLVSSYRADDLPAEVWTCGAAEYLHKDDFAPASLERFWQRATQAS